MRRRLFPLIYIATLLTYTTACATPSPIPTETPQAITVTSSPSPVLLTETPPTATEVHHTQDPNCRNEALFVADITVPDETLLAAGEAFVKTWEIRNVGTCTWNENYSLVFASGEQLGSELSISLSQTVPDSSLQISVEMVAPAANGTFTSIYQLKDPNGELIPVGALDHIWVKIIVGNGTVVILPTTTGPISTNAPASTCTPQRNASYETEILAFINQARTDNGLSALSLNVQLSAAANQHSADMACNSLLSHTGSNGSSVASRVAAQGYATSYSVENIYAGGTAQNALNWWMNDQIHRDVILDSGLSEIGIGYAYVGTSTYGGYFSVVFSSP